MMIILRSISLNLIEQLYSKAMDVFPAEESEVSERETSVLSCLLALRNTVLLEVYKGWGRL